MMDAREMIDRYLDERMSSDEEQEFFRYLRSGDFPEEFRDEQEMILQMATMESGQELPAGLVRLAGIDVDLNRSEVLLEKDTFCDSDLEELFEVKTGEWYTKDGWIVGKNPKMCPGMIVSKQNYFGDVMLEATVRMVEPSTHDVNFMINGEWIEEKNQRGLAYVAGLEAFWHGNIGFELPTKIIPRVKM